MAPTLPDEVTRAATIAEASERLGALIGLAGPAPEPATRRALAEPLFARALMATRKMPALRDRFLASAAAEAKGTPGAAALAAKAAGATLKWGMAGLKPAEPWVIERRLAACAACEFQAPAPDTLVYRGARVATGPDAKICTVCHCLTNTKAALSTERCPKQDPEDATRSRWGEPWVDPADHPEGPW